MTEVEEISCRIVDRSYLIVTGDCEDPGLYMLDDLVIQLLQALRLTGCLLRALLCDRHIGGNNLSNPTHYKDKNTA